jgi:glucose/arabinose dehydrogenase
MFAPFRKVVRPRRFMLPALTGLAILLAACGPAATPVTPTSASMARALDLTPATLEASVPPAETPTLAAAATSRPAPSAIPSVVPSAVSSPVATAVSSPAAPSLDAVRVALRPVADNFAQPVFVTHAGDGSGRLFVVEKPGLIHILEGGRLLPTPFLDIRDRVGSRNTEQGLLGLAFAPNYAGSGTFFVDYTDLSGDTVVARFAVTADPNVADPGSEFTVLKIAQPAANHNGGMLAFGPDGNLYIGAGDGGGAGDRYRNGQNPQTLLGKLLRLDVTSDPKQPYMIPADNPWVNAQWNGQEILPEIRALGLRNPWRFSFDRATGDLWIGDVGQDQYEEVDRVPAGSKGDLNFGWPIMEGTHCYPASADCQRAGLEMPVIDYTHGANGCSITGGYVYRGRQIPALEGVYLYADYCTGKIWGLVRDGSGWRSRELLDSSLNVSSFGEDQAGELYVVDLNGGVYRVVVE